MTRLAGRAALGACALLGCSRDKQEPSQSSAPSATEASETEAPFTGPLTGERILSTKDKVAPFDDWTKGYGKMERLLGKPTRTKGTEVAWGVIESDTCTYTTMKKEDRALYIKGQTGDMVGTYQPATKHQKADTPPMNWDLCIEAAGKPAGPPEDPNALPPAAEGAVMEVQFVLDNASKARSRWDERRVKVSANLGAVSASTWTSGEKKRESVTVHLIAGEALSPYLRCTLREGEAKPETPDPDTHVTVVAEGTVHIAKWLSMEGKDATLEAEFRDCVLTIASPPKLLDDKPPISASAKAPKR